MAATKLRKVGGSTMLAIPPEILQSLSLTAGSSVDLTITDGVITARPTRPRYCLQQLLAEEQAAGVEPLVSVDTDWRDASPVGREIW